MSDTTRPHTLRRMTGRDPHESHRAATPLELLYDLTFVVAFGQAADQLAHLLAEGHVGAGVAGFGFATFAITWAWINFSWFASAYDTDDWAFRLAVMVQMVGVIILALGLPTMFHSLDEGGHIDNGVMVLGYVVMRVAMLFLWLRARAQDPRRRRACTTYVTAIGIAQVGWIALIPLGTSPLLFALCGLLLVVVEMSGPYLADGRRSPDPTPWHPHHIAERYALLAIIALGEGVIGTVASLSAVVEEQGWSLDAALVAVAGTGLTFGMWWIYFVMPSGEVLQRHRERSFPWGYGHILLFGSIVATGAGLHVAAYYIAHEAHVSATAAVLATAVPLAVYVLSVYVLYGVLVHAVDTFHLVLLAGSAVLLVAAVVLAAAGLDVAVCLVVLMLVPVVSVVGFETVGHRHQTDVLERT